VRIAAALQAALRSEDRLYRLGGDELAIVLPATTQEQGRLIAKRSGHKRVALYPSEQDQTESPHPEQALRLALTRALAQDNPNGQMVRSLSRLLLDAGYALVAEGVESPAELERAEELGFGHAQGYLIGRPLPLEHLVGVGPAPARSETQPPACSHAAARSPIMIAGALVLPPTSVGMIEASATRSP